MNNFEFKNPTKILFGKDQIENISNEIPKDAKILMLYGGGSIKKNGIYEQVKTALKDFYKILKLEEETIFEGKKGEAETLAGFILEISGSFPRQASKINFDNYVFTIEALDKKRIKRVKVTIP